jgi:predicted amidophosphoribosyltransferase
MTRPCPACRTNGADYDDPQGLCDECAADCDDCADGSLCAACGDDERFHIERDTRSEERE